jgi:outer membrane protein assembly factor BamB
MRQRTAWAGILLLGTGILLIANPALALITADYPLKTAIDDHQIYQAKVIALDPAKKTAIISLGTPLKGDKAPFPRVAISFNKPVAKLADHADKVLKRLDTGLPLIVFYDNPQKGDLHVLIGYTNGTWFRVQYDGTKPGEEGWRFLHGETYLRRTFKGTTEDLEKTITDYVKEKKEPPKTNPKEEPGFGPEIAPKKGARLTTGPVVAVGMPVDLPLFGVIPTVAIGGPLAILSMLFPTLFGKPKEIMYRYMALLTVVTINSTAYILQAFFENSISQYWWGSPFAVWTFMAVVTLLGMIWAWRRHTGIVATAESQMPARGEVIGFQVLSLIGLALAPYLLGRGLLFKEGGREVIMVCSVVWSGTLGILYLRWVMTRALLTNPPVPPAQPHAPDANYSASPQPVPPTSGPVTVPISLENLMLAGLLVCCVGMAWLLMPSSNAAPNNTNLANNGGTGDPLVAQVHNSSWAAPKFEGVAWTFNHEGAGTMDSTPLVTDKYIFAAVKIPGGFSNYGRVYCLDRATNKVLWTFNDNGRMKAVFSTPCLADGKLYVGEGYHQDSECKLFCLEVDTGKKLWDFTTDSHTESSPCVANGKVFVGAGDDGLYALDAKTGAKLWNYPKFHVDAAPTVIGNRVYCGSGVGDVYKETAIFALDADTGKEVWRVPTELPVWGSPAAEGGFVYFGLGNGNFVEDSDKPAGAMMCVNAENGQRVWIYGVPNGVLNRPTVERQNVFFTCRDGNCYCLDRLRGRLRWKTSIGGSPIVTSPAVTVCPHCGNADAVYVVATNGQVACLDAGSGDVSWSFDVAKHSGKKPALYSSPRIVVSQDAKEGRRRIYFGAGLETTAKWNAALYCLEDKLPSQPAAATKTTTPGAQ